MTARDVIRMLGRRWLVVLVGLVCTALAMTWATGRVGVYATQIDVVFLVPSEPGKSNVLVDDVDPLITFARIIEIEVNAGRVVPRFSSPSATLYGAGVRDGYSVTMPNSGGQWTNYFQRPVLSVEVVGASEAEVRTNLGKAVATIDAAVSGRQRAAGLDPSIWIQTKNSPSTSVVTYIPGSPRRAALAIGLLGIALTGLSANVVDRLDARRGRRRR